MLLTACHSLKIRSNPAAQDVTTLHPPSSTRVVESFLKSFVSELTETYEFTKMQEGTASFTNCRRDHDSHEKVHLPILEVAQPFRRYPHPLPHRQESPHHLPHSSSLHHAHAKKVLHQLRGQLVSPTWCQ